MDKRFKSAAAIRAARDVGIERSYAAYCAVSHPSVQEDLPRIERVLPSLLPDGSSLLRLDGDLSRLCLELLELTLEWPVIVDEYGQVRTLEDDGSLAFIIDIQKAISMFGDAFLMRQPLRSLADMVIDVRELALDIDVLDRIGASSEARMIEILHTLSDAHAVQILDPWVSLMDPTEAFHVTVPRPGSRSNRNDDVLLINKNGEGSLSECQLFAEDIALASMPGLFNSPVRIACFIHSSGHELLFKNRREFGMAQALSNRLSIESGWINR